MGAGRSSAISASNFSFDLNGSSNKMQIPASRAAIVSLALLTAFVPDRTWGSSYNWIAQSGDWSAATNWSGNVVPTANDAAFLQNNGTTAVTQFGETCGTLSLGSGFGASTVQMSAGGLTVASYLYLGPYASSSGTINLSGGALASSSEIVGYSGTGTFTQSGGTNTISDFLFLGYAAGGSGVYNLNGGLLSASADSSAEYLGVNGIGIVEPERAAQTPLTASPLAPATINLAADC